MANKVKETPCVGKYSLSKMPNTKWKKDQHDTANTYVSYDGAGTQYVFSEYSLTISKMNQSF